jgi:hypothetical protein
MEQIRYNPGEITLVTIGGLTNIAALIEKGTEKLSASSSELSSWAALWSGDIPIHAIRPRTAQYRRLILS